MLPAASVLRRCLGSWAWLPANARPLFSLCGCFLCSTAGRHCFPLPSGDFSGLGVPSQGAQTSAREHSSVHLRWACCQPVSSASRTLLQKSACTGPLGRRGGGAKLVLALLSWGGWREKAALLSHHHPACLRPPGAQTLSICPAPEAPPGPGTGLSLT